MIKSLVVAGATLLMFNITPAVAAASTTCVCRTNDGKSFQDSIRRHHRWACDYALGYIKDPENNISKDPERLRPTTQTCNDEEIVQFKVWLCMKSACTYPYARASETETKGLRTIAPLKGERRP